MEYNNRKLTPEIITKELCRLDNELFSIQDRVECGIISNSDAVAEKEMVENKKLQLKKRAVIEAHVTLDGKPRSIYFMETKGLYTTKLPDGKKIYAKTEEMIFDKLFEYYNLTLDSTVLRNVFKNALDEKKITENNANLTITHYESDFKRYISEELAKTDIRKITETGLKAYTQKFVNTEHPTKKMFLAYKGILNLIFRYALEKGLIIKNPVVSIKNNVYLKSCITVSAKPEDKIFCTDEISLIQKEIRHRMTQKKYNGYFINGYAILLAIETGMRVGEICSLKWSDITDGDIWIHSQQLFDKVNDSCVYLYSSTTKNEKGISQDGRHFPVTNQIKSILDELKEKQKERNIESEYVFCHEDGDWIKTKAYETCLRRLCKSHGFKITNNHAFRMSLNSNVLIPLGIPVTERASLLGHSVQTNLNYYSFARKDSLDLIRSKLDMVTP